MKRSCILWISIFAIILSMFSTTAFAVADFPEQNDIFAANDKNTVTLYAPDGRTRVVYEDEVNAYVKVGWYTKPVTLLYAVDGRTRVTYKDEVNAYLRVGWYAKPVTILHALDGRTRVTYKDEVNAYLKVGWYLKPVTLLYAVDGRTRATYKDEVNAYLKVGWYTKPVTLLYAADGRTRVTYKDEVDAYLKVGWYLYQDYIIIQTNNILNTKGFADAVDYIEEIMSKSADKSYYNTLLDKRNSLCDAWRKKIGCPVAILGSEVSHNSIGIPEVYVYYRNLTGSTLNAFELEFTCIDAYGNVTTDFPSLYNGNFTGYSDHENLNPYCSSGAVWTLYSNERTTSIRNLHMTRAAFSDGTTWGK